MNTSGISRRLAAVALAGSFAFAVTPAVPLLTTTAAAQEEGQATQPTADTRTINPDAQVSLTIRVSEGEPGAEDLQAPATEASFQIEKITNIDLTTQAGWRALEGLTPGAVADENRSVVGQIATNGGTATISTASTPAFTVGAYIVTEITEGDYAVAAPFIITLPTTGPDGTWQYSRTVNPKTQNVKPNKQVTTTSNITVGDQIEYQINAPVPAGTLNRFNIVDNLIPNLSVVTDSVTVELVRGPEDVVTWDAENYQIVSAADQTLRVNVSSDGLAALAAARQDNPALQLRVTFKATVNSIPANGNITNTATVELPNDATVTTDVTDDDPQTPDQPTATRFANLQITKTSEGNDGAELAGATFELYRCENADGSWTVDGQAAPIRMRTASGEGATTDTKITTALVDGAYVARGYAIQLSNFAGGTAAQQQNTFCVVETAAPAGFVRNPQPQPVTFNSETPYGAESFALTATVDNRKDTLIGQLPNTGAWGIVLIFLAGLALLARGIYTSMKDSRRNA